MARIKNIHFERVGEKEGCTCDRCGQYIRNIWTVDYLEGFSVHYGLDCWEKVYKNGTLSQAGEKLIKKTMKSIQHYEEMLMKWKSGEMDEEGRHNFSASGAWEGSTFEEYKEWMINDLLPYRLEDAQKELKRFGKIDFKEV